MQCPKCGAQMPEDVQACPQCGCAGLAGAGQDTVKLGSEHETVAKPGFDGPVDDIDPDKNIRMDIDPLSSSGALDALNSLYDTGGMQFPIEGMEGRKRKTSEAKVGRWGAKRREKRGDKDGSFYKRHKGFVIGAISVVAVAAVIAVVFFAILLGRTNAISDSAIRQVLEGDEAFMIGSAADVFVESDPYALQDLNINSRDAWGDGLVVHATAELKNGFFSETREVTLVFPYTEVTDGCAITVDSHAVRAVRGISNDPEYGIAGANPTFDEGAQACNLTQSYEADTSEHWWYSEAGEIYLAYEFSDDSWKRTLADTDSLTTSFQYLVGSYGDVSEAAYSGAGFTSFAIKSVDDATGAVSGTFSWTDGTRGPFGYGTVSGSFSGYVRRDGSIEAASSGAADTLAFTGRLGEPQTMTIEGSVYYSTAFGMGDVEQALFGPAFLDKGAASAVTESDGSSSSSASSDEYSYDSSPYGFDDDWGYGPGDSSEPGGSYFDLFDIFSW